MLVLSRKLGEQIVVPDCEMTVTVVAIEGGNVRLGFTAPKRVDVYRREILERRSKVEMSPGAKQAQLRRAQS